MKLNIFVGSMFALLSTFSYGKSILVLGSVINQTPPSEHVANARVLLQIKGNLVEADYSKEKGTYSKRLESEEYAKEKIALLVQHTNFVQTNPDKDIVQTGFSGRTEHHINVKTKEHLANTLVLSAKRSATSGDYIKALDHIDSASSIYQSFDIYSYKVRLIGDALKTNEDLPVRHTNLASDGAFLSYSQSLSDLDRYKLFLQLGQAYTNVSDPEKEIDDTTTYFDVAVSAYAEAKKSNPTNAKSYQGEYKLYQKTGNHYDAAVVIQSFFKRNPSITRVSTVRAFLADWLTSFEKITGFPYSSPEEISKDSLYYGMAEELLATIKQYESMFKHDNKQESKRLLNATNLLNDIVKGK
ncbi:TPA: hypothetical protein I7217_21820 [Vibrio vulnificus]|uniref:hypothetical protein n=1 Tax=Vibrio vulnificus TaxID=672 RepID=UPI001A2D46C3|nr:hypothetical protein [Vibrio vulnificus]WIL72846.1 hypothetical protein QPX65_07425 [Vibrio vulnificus]HAS6046189.1 hypothetical protein [Vibrio vulnificus]HAT8507016.1 hypothetical protein [Vibrio vulnificus]